MATEPVKSCSIQASLDVLGDRWTILILRDAFRGVRRFDEFRRDLDIARPVLTERLKRLVEHDVLARHLYCDRPPRHEYRLTTKGMRLCAGVTSGFLTALRRPCSCTKHATIRLINNSCAGNATKRSPRTTLLAAPVPPLLPVADRLFRGPHDGSDTPPPVE